MLSGQFLNIIDREHGTSKAPVFLGYVGLSEGFVSAQYLLDRVSVTYDSTNRQTEITY